MTAYTRNINPPPKKKKRNKRENCETIQNSNAIRVHFAHNIKIKSLLYSRYYAEACNELRAYLRGLAPGLHSSEETSQRWRAVSNTVPI